MSDGQQEQGKQYGLSLKGQYIKDLSFENPRAPQSLLSLREPPAIDINVDLNAQRVQETLFELTISISARAIHEKNTIFLTDLSYGGIFEVVAPPEADLEKVVLIDCAFILFPFARRVIAEVTRDGGFPPLQLEPIDFHALYLQNKDNIQRSGNPENAG
ncbi:MAG: protein-export chaperone SecB [Rickettsiales bacterium]|nr:protein-export chaperone SecB [Rickettsiales bacterium]